jgi:hypothetical protein
MMDCIACKLRNIISERDKRITEARRLIICIGWTSVERIEIIQAADKWLEGKP